MKSKDLDAGFGGVEDALVFKGARHLALQAAGTLFRLEFQGSEHHDTSCGLFIGI
jgi:hypothetical protein